MDLGTPQDWAQGVGAFKTAVEAIGNALKLMREYGGSGKRPKPEEEALIEKALVEAEKAAKLADAETAKALGYALCKCQFPPVPMLTVGHHNARGPNPKTGPVFECPRCGFDTASPYSYTRTAPPRSQGD